MAAEAEPEERFARSGTQGEVHRQVESEARAEKAVDRSERLASSVAQALAERERVRAPLPVSGKCPPHESLEPRSRPSCLPADSHGCPANRAG